MGEPVGRRAAPRGTSRPRWNRLYAPMVAAIIALAIVEVIPLGDASKTALRLVIAVGTFLALRAWVRRNLAALDQEDWCACASATVSVRVVPSRGAVPAAIEAPGATRDERRACAPVARQAPTKTGTGQAASTARLTEVANRSRSR
jgi:hypothetical protein